MLFVYYDTWQRKNLLCFSEHFKIILSLLIERPQRCMRDGAKYSFILIKVNSAMKAQNKD